MIYDLIFIVKYDIIVSEANRSHRSASCPPSYALRQHTLQKMDTIILFIIALIVAFGNWALIGYMVGKKYYRLYTPIPTNHCICVIKGGEIQWFVMNKQDKDKVLANLKKIGRTNDWIKEHIKIKVRWGLMKKLFGLHLISINPFCTIQFVTVVRTKVDSKIRGDDIHKIVIPEAEEKPLLRLEFPRIVRVDNVELLSLAKVDEAVEVTKIQVADLYYVFATAQGKISESVDNAIKSAVKTFTNGVNWVDFQAIDTSATANKFNNGGIAVLLDRTTGQPKSIRLDGVKNNLQIQHVGCLYPADGFVGIYDWEADESQQKITEAMQDQAVAEAERISKMTRAVTYALELETKSKADAAAIVRLGAAEGEMYEKLFAAYKKAGATDEEAVKYATQGQAVRDLPKSLTLLSAGGNTPVAVALTSTTETTRKIVTP